MSPLAHRFAGASDGEPVLFLNGGMMSMAAWMPFLERLPGVRALLCDLRGQLLSPGEAHRRLQGNVSDVIGLLDRLGLDAVHVVGTSFGGEIGLLLAAMHPRRVRSLAAVNVIAEPAPITLELGAETRRLVEQAVAGGDRDAFYRHLVDSVYSTHFRRREATELEARASQVASLPDAWYRGLLGILEAVDHCDLAAQLPAIECPCLVVAAAHDAVMPVDETRRLAAAIADAELVVHPTSGHALVVEDPAWLAAELRAFYRRLGDAAPRSSDPPTAAEER